MVDVLVIGGGPAGLATAVNARLRGLSTRILEPRSEVIDKACGEGLMPAAVKALTRLGVEIPRSHVFEGVRYVAGEVTAEGRFPEGPGLGVRRTVLHRALRARAVELGVDIVAERAREVVDLGDRVEVGAHVARYVVAADGLHSPTRRQLGLGLPPRRPRRLGVRRHFAVAPWSPMVEVHWSTDAEAYVTPVDDALVGIAILYYPDRVGPAAGEPPFERLLRGFPALAARLGEPVTKARGAGPFEQRVARRVVGRVLLVGDAAGYLDPLTGEGIRLGLETSEAAVDAIIAGEPRTYEAEWQRIVRRYWWMTDGLLKVSRGGWTRRALVPAARSVPGVMGLAIGMLGA